MCGGTIRSGWRRAVGAAFATAVVLAPVAEPARAAEFELVGALGADSTGAFRGVKSERLNPSVYGYVELVRGDMLAGVFANPVSIAGETNALVLGYASWRPVYRGFRFEAGGRYYAFPDSSIFSYDFNSDGIADHSGRKGLFEAQIGVRRRFEGGRVELRGFWTPDNFAETGPAWYANGEARADIAHGFDIRGAVGFSRYSDHRYNENYADYNIGVYKTAFGLDMFVRYSDTAGLSGADNSVLVFGVEKAWTIASSAGRDLRRFEKILNDWNVDKSMLGITGRR